jgi:transaldolase
MPRIDEPVDPIIIEELLNKFPDFGRAYKEEGLSAQEFDTFPPTVRTLRQFIDACHGLAAYVRDLMLPNPDATLV